MYLTFLESQEPGRISEIRETVAKVCETSALAAAGNRQLAAYEVHIYFVDMGDGDTMYLLDEEAVRIISEAGIAVGSKQETSDLPDDASNILASTHYRV